MPFTTQYTQSMTTRLIGIAFSFLFTASACAPSNKGTSANAGGGPRFEKPDPSQPRSIFFLVQAGLMEAQNLAKLALAQDASRKCISKSGNGWRWICTSTSPNTEGRQGSLSVDVNNGGARLRTLDNAKHDLWRGQGRQVKIAPEAVDLDVRMTSSTPLVYSVDFATRVRVPLTKGKNPDGFSERTWQGHFELRPSDSKWTSAALFDLVVEFDEVTFDSRGAQVGFLSRKLTAAPPVSRDSASLLSADECGRLQGEMILEVTGDKNAPRVPVSSSFVQGVKDASGQARIKWLDCANELSANPLPYLW